MKRLARAAVKKLVRAAGARAGFELVRRREWEMLQQERCRLLAAAVERAPRAAVSSAPVECVIFSKDRPMQLGALLASLQEKVRPAIPVHVLYRSSTDAFEQGYRVVFRAFERRVVPHPERHFRADLIAVLRLIQAARLFFLVDDDLFIDECDLDHLYAIDPAQTIFSLRLGQNLTHAYPFERPLRPPPLVARNGYAEQLTWCWRGADLAWGYPLSVDGHIFSSAEMLVLAEAMQYAGPNTFEAGLQSFNPCFADRLGACYRTSRMINVPMNRVQSEIDNPSDNVSVDLLLEKWLSGLALDHRVLYGMSSSNTHHYFTYPLITRSELPVYRGN